MKVLLHRLFKFPVTVVAPPPRGRIRLLAWEMLALASRRLQHDCFCLFILSFFNTLLKKKTFVKIINQLFTFLFNFILLFIYIWYYFGT